LFDKNIALQAEGSQILGFVDGFVAGLIL